MCLYNFYAKVIVQIIRTVQVACYFIDRTISKTSNQTANFVKLLKNEMIQNPTVEEYVCYFYTLLVC